MKRRKFIQNTGIFAVTSAAYPLLLNCHSSSKKTNVVFLLADQLRACSTGYAGDPNVSTPYLDILAKESLNFQNAVSVCPVCTPYRASLMTGKYPTSTGMFLNDLHLPEHELCIAEVFKSNGYDTGYIGKWHLDGYGRKEFIPLERRQGFDYWKVAECDHNYNHSHYYSGNSNQIKFWEGYDVFAQTEDAIHYIQDHSNSDRPFFLFVSYGTPHFPHHTAPEEFKNKYPSNDIVLRANVPEHLKTLALAEAQGYYAHIEALDQNIGKIMQALEGSGINENTILVFTSDHGEMLGSQGIRPSQKQVPWHESSGVPLLMKVPGMKSRLVNMPITTPDLSATLIGLTGLNLPKSIEGNNFCEVLKHEKDYNDYAALFMGVAPFARVEKDLNREYRAIRTEQYTYVRGISGPWLLYDNLSDPLQLNNLISNAIYSDVLKSLDSQLIALLKKHGDNFMPADFYISFWGYEIDKDGEHIPYKEFDQTVQTPKPNSN